MRILLYFSFLLFLDASVVAQTTDIVQIRKKNSTKVLKSYFPTAFIAGSTYDGFQISGIIKAIHGDTLYIAQQETKLMRTEFGSVVDTMFYTVGIPLVNIERFYFGSRYENGKSKGFAQATLPNIMVVAGTAYVGLELFNTLYRRESLNEHNKWPSLIGASTAALTGYLWKKIARKRDRVGGRYVAVYIKTGSIKTPS